MSIERARSLKNNWQSDNSLQQAIERALDAIGFTDAYVKSSISRAKATSHQKSKQIKDNQWGMMEFDWREMRLIDSPVLQRLRYVKQLGFSYLTYPSAEHSRFSHSLGIGHVVKNFIRAIDKRALEQNPDNSIKYQSLDSIPGLSSADLVHAALLHDIGHLPFSHVTEKVLTSQPQLFSIGGKSATDILLAANLQLGKNLPLSEVLTLIILLSRRFENFYRNFVCADLPNSQVPLLTICCLIAGIPPNQKLTGVSELISGAVDADKVDYVNRDALNCGIPVGVDVARVFLRSGIILASIEQIRSLGFKSAPTTEEYLFVINSSGLDTIDEILQARTALYQRVYFHAVTRTAERIFGRALELNGGLANADRDLTNILKIWSYRDVELLERIGKSRSPVVKKLISRVTTRNLPKKAYSFSPGLGNLQTPIHEILPNTSDASIKRIKKQVKNTIIEEHLREERLWRGDGAILERDIRSEAKKIIEAISSSNDLELIDQFDTIGPDCLIAVGNAHEKQKNHNPIICQNDHLLTVRDYSNAREQQDAFELLKEIGFVLCDEQWRAVIFFAARVVLARMENKIGNIDLEFKIGPEKTIVDTVRQYTRFLPDYTTSILRSGVSGTRIRQVHSALASVGYFDDKCWAAEPFDDSSEAAIQIARRLEKFNGVRGWSVTPKSVAAYLSQFPIDLRDAMADSLLAITVFDADAIVAGIQPILEGLETGADVVAFSATSGYQVHAMLKRELRGQGDLRFPADIAAALAHESDDPIVFVDDNSASGVQARAQLLNLLGVDRADWPIECQDEHDLLSPLSQEQVSLLKTRDVHLIVCAGSPAANKAIKAEMKKNDFDSFKGLRYSIRIDRAFQWKSKLKNYLSEVGQSVIASTLYQRNFSELTPSQKAKCRERALGYGNVGALVATNSSVPTSTVSALWCPGVHRGEPWVPLLLRSSKLSNLVIS
ncbi:HD domain-containing protein [Bradyrhizobium sp. CCBAU 53338]|uniref:phosphoribosyltransferase-like protein n=1 Tax=Bradyrhizobium sp. CCBAU 53338 TaxID=1325111 RepID=UPI00188D1202|nr:HD domain-containing protein [Bradyrhizobium sp. CCBAU 53338]QOZ55873.1 hypothetical protein XH90_34220 [Bradyrhizobium sp. CCBAU 53338]